MWHVVRIGKMWRQSCPCALL